MKALRAASGEREQPPAELDPGVAAAEPGRSSWGAGPRRSCAAAARDEEVVGCLPDGVGEGGTRRAWSGVGVGGGGAGGGGADGVEGGGGGWLGGRAGGGARGSGGSRRA